MEPYGTSWADQWDSQPDPSPSPAPETKKDRYAKKVGEGFGKTKEAASTGVKKVKHGASFGFNWIKDKVHKPAQKN